MSRAWMPWFIGDYLRDTAHLTTEQHGAYLLLLGHCWQHGAIPTDDQGCASVAKLTLKRWKLHKETISTFFNEDGTHKRVTQELERAEIVSLRRKIAGAKGGFHSAIARAKAGPKLKQLVQQNPSNSLSNSSSNRIDNHKVSKKEEGEPQSACSLATALPSGALASKPQTEQGARRGLSTESLEEVVRRKGWAQ